LKKKSKQIGNQVEMNSKRCWEIYSTI